MLSYDWLKIIIAIVFAVLGLVVFFTTVETRPGKYREFQIYGYREILGGEASMNLGEEFLRRGVFSYDILNVEFETFGTGQYSEATFTARRSAGEGTVMFTTTNKIEDDQTVLERLTGGANARGVVDLAQYMTDCENYLVRFFGENWREGTLDAAEAERCFLNRNEKDKRFRSAAKKAAGIEQEKQRLEKLRADYLVVSESFESGLLGFSYVADENGAQRANAVALGKLNRLKSFCYYAEETDGASVRSVANVCLLLFSNDGDAGKPASAVVNDLRYEPISFLKYLVSEYGA